jgi:hypothetical protein
VTRFQEHFDVVLVDDQTMEFPLAVLAEIEARVQLQHNGVQQQTE